MPGLLDRLTRAGRALPDRARGRSQRVAVVFLARDLRHDRPEAIKVPRPKLAGILEPARFLREIQLAALLTHPHILTMLDSGEDDDWRQEGGILSPKGEPGAQGAWLSRELPRRSATTLAGANNDR
jgi:hypothetical protein